MAMHQNFLQDDCQHDREVINVSREIDGSASSQSNSTDLGDMRASLTWSKKT